MYLTYILLSVFTIFLSYFLYTLLQDRRKKWKFPPCPGRNFLLGSIRYIEKPLPQFLLKKYGKHDLVMLYFGNQRIFYLNSLKAAKEAYINLGENFSYRQVEIFNEVNYGEKGGIAMSDGEIWREYRRFTMKTLRDFGYGKSITEEHIVEEIRHLRETIDSKLGQPLDSAKLLGPAVSNVICMFLFGSRLAAEDSQFVELLDAFAALLQQKDHTEDLITNSIIRTIFRDNGYVAFQVIKLIPEAKRVFSNFYRILQYCDEQKELNRKKFDSSNDATNYIEAHFHHILENKDLPEGTSRIFNDKRLSLAMADLFIAGTDTTTSTLRWAFLFGELNPECIEKAAEEVLREVGPDRMPSMKDKVNCHYVQAYIEETHRCAVLVPLTLAHRSLNDVKLCGYDIPKDSLTFINVYSIHNNPEVFPEPEKFIPERHLDSNGHYVQHEHVIPFSLGKRSCLGESLARTELFLFMLAFLQRYRIRMDPKSAAKATELLNNPTPGDVRALKDYDVIFELRK